MRDERWLRFWFGLILAGAGLAMGACSDSTGNLPDSNGLCSRDEDCPLGQYCDDGLCTPAAIACVDPQGCPEGMTCRKLPCSSAATDSPV